MSQTRKSVSPRRRRRRPTRKSSWYWPLLAIELVALVLTALTAVVIVLGHAAMRFAGSDPWRSLLPFASVVLALSVSTALFIKLWRVLRSRITPKAPWLPACLAVSLLVFSGWTTRQPGFDANLRELRILMGGAAEAERSVIAHQVYAAYRRMDPSSWQQLLERSRVFEPTVREAAVAFGVDVEIMMGIAAAESSFYPRDSKDGGRGLFQITAPPQIAVDVAKRLLRVSALDPLNQRHNAFLAAATLRHYLAQMRADLFLGLLAYNIGPKNGGLQSIMQQYGARDFATIQPYLQQLPRDYPIRVLSAALAYRVWQKTGTLPRYEVGDNAQRIQRTGIPGLGPPDSSVNSNLPAPQRP